MSEPRVLAIMGSGETAPAMARVHRALLKRLGDRPGPATNLDTPYGFQENADEISEKLVEFFAVRLGRELTIASYRSRSIDPLDAATAVARIYEANYVLAGPGSPSYALRQWIDGPIADALADKLAGGGIVTVASAAALTLGIATIPVYEIYKAGAEPYWLTGLNLLEAATGLRAAIVPHYDNAEGGTHDTRFCYLGERRLGVLEQTLPDGTFVLGVDGHTALILDLERGAMSVAGLGTVTVRVNGRSIVFASGTQLPIIALVEAARQLGLADAPGTNLEAETGATPAIPVFAHGAATPRPGGRGDPVAVADVAPEVASLAEEVAVLERVFAAAVDAHEAPTAVAALFELDSVIDARIRAGADDQELDRARTTFRAMLARLGEAALDGLRDPRDAVEPFVGTLLNLRARARALRDWEAADLIRDRLTAAGVEVRDDGNDSTWILQDPADR